MGILILYRKTEEQLGGTDSVVCGVYYDGTYDIVFSGLHGLLCYVLLHILCQ